MRALFSGRPAPDALPKDSGRQAETCLSWNTHRRAAIARADNPYLGNLLRLAGNDIRKASAHSGLPSSHRDPPPSVVRKNRTTSGNPVLCPDPAGGTFRLPPAPGTRNYQSSLNNINILSDSNHTLPDGMILEDEVCTRNTGKAVPLFGNGQETFRMQRENRSRIVYYSTAILLENNLVLVPRRDIMTPDGLSLTLMNSASMTRQVAEMAWEAGDFQGRITSLNPIRPENRPDPWETKSLKTFKRGQCKLICRSRSHHGRPDNPASQLSDSPLTNDSRQC